jgi:imidazolonepropionase-like amidohydrolase
MVRVVAVAAGCVVGGLTGASAWAEASAAEGSMEAGTDGTRPLPLIARMSGAAALVAMPQADARPDGLPWAFEPGTPDPKPWTTVLFTNVRVFDGRGDAVSGPMNVLVKDGKIAKIDAGPIAVQAGELTKVIDGGGRVLMPGMIDTHIHFAVNLPPEALKGSDLMYVGLRAGREAEKTLMRGFTSARDMGGPVFGLKRAIDEGLVFGPRIYPSGAMISQTSGHADFRKPTEPPKGFGGQPDRFELIGGAMIVDGRAQVLTAVREQLRLGATQIKMLAGGGITSPADPLDVQQFTLDELKAGTDAAGDWGTYVATHVYNPAGIRRALEAGVRSIEHAHLIDEPTMMKVVEAGAFVNTQVLTFAVPMAGLTDEQNERMEQAKRGTKQLFELAKKHGAKVTFGTDLLGDPRLMSLANKELTARLLFCSPADVLRQATSRGGELLAMSGNRNPYPGKLGVVEEGALADLLLVDGDPLANLQLLEDPAKNLLVIMKGGVVYKHAVQ